MKLRLFLSCLAALALAGQLRAADDDPVERVKLARDRVKSQNNLKQIAIAFHAYHDAYNAMPRDLTDKQGKPLLSWRVAILPFIEEGELYKQFKLDEAWDSESNKELLEKLPKVYTAPRGKFEKGQTFYQSFAGEGALMSGKPIKIFAIPDGTSNTFMVAEAGEPVEWTKPADIAYEAKKPLPKLGGVFGGDFNVAFCDGSVRYVKKGVADETLKKFITIAGGEVVDYKDLESKK
jgi:prepilin-type processing-associated H-X9-DG protein